jgi:hypothetical protein
MRQADKRDGSECQLICVNEKLITRTSMPQVAQTEDEKQEAVVQTKEKW